MNAFSDLPDKSTDAPKPAPVLVMPPPSVSKASRAQLWVQRFWLVVFVLFSLEVGVILVVGPWTRAWTENSLSSSYPALHQFLMNEFVRGAVTGLGVVDFWIGIARAVSYRESVS